MTNETKLDRLFVAENDTIKTAWLFCSAVLCQTRETAHSCFEWVNLPLVFAVTPNTNSSRGKSCAVVEAYRTCPNRYCDAVAIQTVVAIQTKMCPFDRNKMCLKIDRSDWSVLTIRFNFKSLQKSSTRCLFLIFIPFGKPTWCVLVVVEIVYHKYNSSFFEYDYDTKNWKQVKINENLCLFVESIWFRRDGASNSKTTCWMSGLGHREAFLKILRFDVIPRGVQKFVKLANMLFLFF